MSDERILSDEERAFWEENGYVIIPNAVPQELLDGVIDAIWEHLGVKGDDPEDWYRVNPRNRTDHATAPIVGTGGVRLSCHHQAFWDTRQYPKMHRIFAEILGTEKLWVSFDRASMKPPVHPDHPEWDSEGLKVHWDLDTDRIEYVPLTVQGVLCLTDTDEKQGGFCCVPGFYKEFDAWKKSLPEGASPRRPPFEKEDMVPIPGKAGDLIVWHRLTPHANGRNESNRPRMGQYITMYPAKEDNERLREERIDSWREDAPMRATRLQEFDLDYQETRTHDWEARLDEPPKLTALGRKLVGIDTWE